MIEMVADRILTAIFCCDVDPESEGAFEKVDEMLKSFPNGTMNGWRCVREKDAAFFGAPWEQVKPVSCKDHAGRWHYVALT